MSGPRILLVCDMSEGHTAEIATRIADVFRKGGAEVDLGTAETAPPPSAYDVLVVGDSIRAAHHGKQLRRYLSEHARSTGAMPTALFQVSMTSVTSDGAPESQAQRYVRDLMGETGFDPDVVGMFAGALAYTKYGWVKRRLMRQPGTRQRRRTGLTRGGDDTDWAAVEQFADDVLNLVLEASPSEAPHAVDVQILDRPETPAAVLDVTAGQDELGQAFDAAFRRLSSALAAQGIVPTGPGFTVYQDVADPKAWRMTVGFPVASSVTGSGAVRAGVVPGGRLAVAVHAGPYARLRETWGALEDWMRREGHRPGGAPFERYLLGDSSEPDPALWRTEVAWPLG